MKLSNSLGTSSFKSPHDYKTSLHDLKLVCKCGECKDDEKVKVYVGFSINHHHHKWNSLMKINEGKLNEGKSSHAYLCASCFTNCQLDPCHRLSTSLTWFMNPQKHA